VTRIGVLLSLVLLAVPAAGQEAVQQLRFGGSEVFRFALHQHGIQPIKRPEDAVGRPHETVIVVFGEPGRMTDQLPGWRLQQFLNNGGAILIASRDRAPQGLNGNHWASAFGITITSNTVTADPRLCYKGELGKPFVKPRQRVDLGGQSPFDLFNGVDSTGPDAIATDRPSEMGVNDQMLRLYLVKNLAGYADGATRVGDHLPVQPAFNHFAISIESQRRPVGNPFGRMIVIADQGVFSNGMMGFVKDQNDEKGYRLDNENWAFTNRTIEWLQGGNMHRTKCLFIENGTIVDRFATELPNAGPPAPDIPPDVIANWALNALNPIVNEAQDRDIFNSTVERIWGMPALLRAFLVVTTILFLVAAFRWMRRGYRKAEPAAVITPNAQATLQPRGGVLRQRTTAQLEVGNLYEATRRRVRERFDVLGGRPGSEGKMPPVLTANDLPDGPLLHQSVRWLWALGYGETPIAIPPADWDRTNVLLERVTARAARGDWSFGQDV
jgi:hypothetical protein